MPSPHTVFPISFVVSSLLNISRQPKIIRHLRKTFNIQVQERKNKQEEKKLEEKKLQGRKNLKQTNLSLISSQR